MATGRRRDEWERFAYLAAYVVNTAAMRSGDPVQPSKINPFLLAEQARKRPIRRVKPSEMEF